MTPTTDLQKLLAKATKGPWLITGVRSGHMGDIYAPTAKQIPDCHWIARCFAPTPSKPAACTLAVIGETRDAIAIIEANARLIAMAPDLAARALELEAENERLGEETRDCWSALRDVVQKSDEYRPEIKSPSDLYEDGFGDGLEAAAKIARTALKGGEIC